jgi:tetratricopeptide (TPR) repeat protein
MKSTILAVGLLVAAGPVLAQRHKPTINTETPEGRLLQTIGQEPEAGKLPLLEQFATQYPKHEALAWVYALMIPAYAKANQPDKQLDVCGKLLALDPQAVEDAHECLKGAEAKKDPDAVKKWALLTSNTARKVAASPKPKDEDEVEDWKKRVDYAKQVDIYTDYSLYATVLQTPDPKKKIELGDALEQNSPQTQYLGQVRGAQFLAYQQLGDKENAVRVAEKALEKDPNNEDMLLAAADYYMNKKDAAKTLAYSNKLTELMGTKPAPQGVAPADWEKRKGLMLGVGYWMAGMTYSGQNKFPQADAALRLALPYVKGNDQFMPSTLFHLGLANYKSEKIVDALKFFEQCAAVKSPFQLQAQKNIRAIRAQYVIKNK